MTWSSKEEKNPPKKTRMLYIVGLGLGDEKDMTLRGLEAIKKCSKVYMEAYTSLLSFGITSDGLSKLEGKFYGIPIIVSDREMVEEKADDMLLEALVSDVAFLVVGDPFGATTHSDLVVQAKKLGVDVKVVHYASVMNAIGVCGLQLYHFGETISIPYFTETWKPYSFYEKIKRNRELGLHMLCLLDIKVKEPSLESLCRLAIDMCSDREEGLRATKVYDDKHSNRTALGGGAEPPQLCLQRRHDVSWFGAGGL